MTIARQDGDEPGRRRDTVLATVALVVASYAFRLPPLLNARSTNSDAAIVGLEAMHLLRGEHAWFLWGSGYQTAADAYVAAGFFAVLGATPVALMLSSLTLHVIATLLVFATLRRRASPWIALLLTAPMILAPSSIHSYALYPPRQLSLTLAIAAFYAIHGASRLVGGPARRWLAAGGLAYGLAIAADPYPMVLAPVILGYGLLVAADRPLERVLPFLSGFLGGLVPFVLLQRAPGAKSGPMGLSLAVIGHNWDLLVRECLPWALSYKVYYARDVMNYVPWDAPLWARVVMLTGAVAVPVLVAIALVAVFRPSVPRSTRMLGACAAIGFPATIAAFLVSVMVMDHFSMRYLAVLTVLLPFAAAPAASLLRPRWFALLLVPHLAASALGGWVGYGPFVHGLVPVRETPELADDYALRDLLRARGVTHAEADYWTSYRLTFLFREEIVVVPTNAREDRYPPYRRAFEAAPTFAYVFDPGRSREDLAEAERELVLGHAHVEHARAGRLTVLVVTR